MTTTKTYDYLDRLTAVSSVNGSSVVLDSHGYSYNIANQRTSVTNADGTFWIYGYDSLGQVISGVKYWPDGTVVAGQQFGYAFDTIGNRATSTAGGDQWGANLRYENYSANNLNQYTARTVPGAVDVVGVATNTASVTVNNQATYRKGNYYRAQLPLNNASGPVFQSVTNLAVLHEGTNADILTNLDGNVLWPPANQTFSYDADGNLLSDSLWNYGWDAENRLIALTNVSGLAPAGQKRLNFTYDYMGRRIQKIVSTNSGSAWVPTSTNLFVYDGWNLLAVVNGANNVLTQSFAWEVGSAGASKDIAGVGGLLFANLQGSISFACYDGNGNVTALVSASSASLSAQYEFSAFGELIRATGPMARANPLRFSTDFYDDETDLISYPHRYYNPSTGRWLSRDPADEIGGLNLYGMVGNDPINSIDPLGLWGTKQHNALIDKWLERNHPPNGQEWDHYKWRCIEVDVPTLLKMGNAMVDGVGMNGPGTLEAFCDAQSSSKSYQHAMRAWYQGADSAEAKYDTFIQKKIDQANSIHDDAVSEANAGDMVLAKFRLQQTIITIGEAQHPVADSTSPPHIGFQLWYGLLDGPVLLSPPGYLEFVLRHHARENPGVYDGIANSPDGPWSTVAGQMHQKLLDVLQQ